jgi:ADP-ribose pyrophosphatase YjhB (NUDIX family)
VHCGIEDAGEGVRWGVFLGVTLVSAKNPAKPKDARGLPTKLGAKVTLPGAAGGTVAPAPGKGKEEEVAVAAAAPVPAVKAEEPKRDSMRLSSLGDWLSKGPEQKVTSEEKTGVIGGIIAGMEEEESSEEDEMAVAVVEKSSVMQLEELSDSVETLLVSLVLCRRRTRFLCIQELDGTWYIPGGTVDAGESFEGAAMRNALDEANVTIRPEGILRVEYSTSNGVRVRVVFKAQPQDPTILPKQEADENSLQAKWLSSTALKKFRLRTEQVLEMFAYMDRGGEGDDGGAGEDCPCYSMSILECPPFGPERSQIDHDQSVTLLVHRAHLVLVDRKRRVFVLPDKSLPTMTLKEGTSFLRFPTIMVNKYCGLFGLDAGQHATEILHIWHAPPNPLDAVGCFAVTYVQKVRSEFSASCNSVSLDTIKNLKVRRKSVSFCVHATHLLFGRRFRRFAIGSSCFSRSPTRCRRCR